MPRPVTVLVAGATGRQGGAVARRLLERGHHVRAFTRHPAGGAARALQAAGAEIRAGDLGDPTSVRHAARGADALFLVTDPREHGVSGEIRLAALASQAAREAGVRQVVYSSMAGANRETGVPQHDSKAAAELFIRELGLPYTIVAPTFFMENLLEPPSLRCLRAGWLWLPLPPGRAVQVVTVQDLARLVVLALERPAAFCDRRLEIAGDELSPAQMAMALSAVSGTAIGHTLRHVPGGEEPDEPTPRMFEWLAEVGFDVDLRALHRSYPEVGWHDFVGWARGQDWSVLDEASPDQPTA
jgi:uncharacterized protein YbjT (DUF2867 family)